MRHFLSKLLIVALSCASVAHAKPGAQCIGLVLGGGGARGVAHIGVLKVLERERIPICKIAGTSMGSVAGGLYASGYSADEIEQILYAIDWKDVLNDDPPRSDFPMRRKNETLRYLINFRFGLRDGAIQWPRGVVQGQKLLLLLRRLTLHTWKVPNFDALPIAFRAVATDLVSGEQVLFKDGDLGLAIRASMSVPAAFAPTRVDGRLLVDGGLVNNVPVDVAQAMGADRLIVVDIGTVPATQTSMDSPFAITMQMLDVLMRQRTAQLLQKMASEDVILLPQLGDIGVADFDRSSEAIASGEAAAQLQIDRLRQFAVSPEVYRRWREQHRRVALDPPLVSFIDVLTERSKTSGFVERRLDNFVGAPLDVAILEKSIGGAFGLGNYERIDWRPVEDDGRTGIEVTPVDKSWGPNFITFGLQLSDDFEGNNNYQLGIEYTKTGLNRYGAEWRSRLDMGRVTGLRSEYFQPFGARGQFDIAPYIEYRAFDQPLRFNDQALRAHRLRRGTIGVDMGYEFAGSMRIFGGLLRTHGSASSRNETRLSGGYRSETGGARFGLTRDTLDDANFPSNGSRTELLMYTDLDLLSADGAGQVAQISWDKALSVDVNHVLFGAHAQTSWGSPGLLDALAPLGGFSNLSGYGERELLGEHSLLLRAVVYRRLGDEGVLFSYPAFVGASLEVGQVYQQRGAMFGLQDLIYGSSLFVGVDSPVGPIFVGYGLANSGASSVYLNFGSLLRP